MSAWQEGKLTELVEFKTGKLNSNAAVESGQYPFFTCSPETLRINDFAFDCEALLLAGNNAEGNFSLKYYFGKFNAYQRTYVVTIPDANLLSYKYVFYYLKTKLSELQNISAGSATKFLTLTILNEIEIFLPEIDEQKAIAAVLSSLDDKIDLLHRQNKTLEAMAETLFRQWFVEEAQDDWEKKSLLDLVELVGGGTPKTSMAEYWDGDIPWLSGGDIATNHKGFVTASEKSITKAGLKNSSAKLLPKYATVISARGTVGKYCLLACDMAFSQSNYGILPRIEDCFFFTYLLVNHVIEELQSAAYGSVFDTITTSTFREATFAIPPTKKVLEFEGIIAKYFGKKFLNQMQIRTLENLRDTLLPKLMSGEVRVAYGAD